MLYFFVGLCARDFAWLFDCLVVWLCGGSFVDLCCLFYVLVLFVYLFVCVFVDWLVGWLVGWLVCLLASLQDCSCICTCLFVGFVVRLFG